MYQRVLLALDTSQEGHIALRQGARIAAALQAEAHVLVVTAIPVEAVMAGGLHAAPVEDEARELLRRGLEELRECGAAGTGEIVCGEPFTAITGAAVRFRADLVVIGRRRRTLFERWWWGRSGADLADHLDCSILVARTSQSQFGSFEDVAGAPAVEPRQRPF